MISILKVTHSFSFYDRLFSNSVYARQKAAQMLTEKVICARLLKSWYYSAKKKQDGLPGGAQCSATKGSPVHFVCWRRDFPAQVPFNSYQLQETQGVNHSAPVSYKQKRVCFNHLYCLKGEENHFLISEYGSHLCPTSKVTLLKNDCTAKHKEIQWTV